MKNLKSQSIESREQLKNKAVPGINNISSAQRISSGNKTTQPHTKSLSTTEFNWAPTQVKPNPLGLKPPQQRIQHVININQTRNSSSSSSVNRQQISGGSQKTIGLSQSPVKLQMNRTVTNSSIGSVPATSRNNGLQQIRKISEGNNEASHVRANSANKINPAQIKQKSLSEISRIEGFIEDQKAKIEQAQHAKNVRAIRAQNVVQQKVMSETNLNSSSYNSNQLGSSTQDSNDQDNSIKSLTDLNEIDEVYEGTETPMNPRRGVQSRQKESEGFGEQDGLVKMISAMEEQRNQNRTLEEIKQLEEKKEELRLLRERQLKGLMNMNGGEEEEKTLAITFLRNEMNFRTILREKFTKNKYTNIDIIFEDDEVQLTDCVLFEQQNESLKQLQLTFSNANNFNEETLGAIKYIKLRNLQNLILNFARSKHTKQLINYSLFNLAYIPRVEINFSANDQLIYLKEDFFIPIDFSNFEISVRDLQKLNRHLIEFQTTHLHFILNENTYLSTCTESSNMIRSHNKRRTQVRRQSQIYVYPHQIKSVVPIHQITNLPNEKILYEIGHIFAKLKHIKISFKNCNLGEADLHSFVLGLLETNSTEGENSVGVFGNNTLESLELNFEGNHAIQEGFFIMFKQQNFKKLQEFTLIFDKTNQILKQYEQFNTFHFVNYLKNINKVKFITNFDQVIYEHNLSHNKCYLSISYLEISPFQLVDIQKALNIYKNTLDLTLDISNNYKLPYRILKNFINELQCIKNNVKRLHLNLTNTNISELEFICLYLSVSHIHNLTVKYDIELSNLLRVTDSYSKLFLHHLGETILDKDMFKIKFNYLLNQLQQNPYLFTHANINFYYNYALTPELFEDSFKPFLQHHTELTSLTLDFNYNCYEPEQVLAMMNTVLTALQSNKPFQMIKLSFLNNHQVPLEQLITIFKKFLNAIPQLQNLVLVTDQYVVEKLSQKCIIVQNLTVHPANIKVNKLSEIKLIPKKLYIAKKISPEQFANDAAENEDDDQMSQSQMILPKLFDLSVPARAKKVLSSKAIPSAIITYDNNNPAISLVSLQKNIKELAKNHQYEQVCVLCDTNAVELEGLHSENRKQKK